jgi:molybdate transport system substrate-binding protein
MPGQKLTGLSPHLRRAKRICAIVLATLVMVACTSPTPQPDPEPLLVSAASNLLPAFEELGQQYQEQTGRPVVFNFAASGQLAQQIEQGAPVDLFVSADVDYVKDLAAEGRVVPDSVHIYARGRLTLWTRADSRLNIETVQDLLKPEVQRLAIANPEHAPYGVVARQALQSAGVWDMIQDKLVFGENVRQTLQFAEAGDVDVAIVPLSLSVTSKGQWTLIPADLHSPIDQAFGVVTGSPRQSTARDFAAFITGPQGRDILSKYGYELPEEGSSP